MMIIFTLIGKYITSSDNNLLSLQGFSENVSIFDEEINEKK
jgi:hypothetical protein